MLKKTALPFILISFIAIVIVLISWQVPHSDATTSFKKQTLNQDKPKNIVLFVVPGMGVNHLEALRLYSKSNLAIDQKPVLGLLSNSGSGEVNINGALSALANGQYSSNESFGFDDKGNKLENLMEIAQNNGYKTGIITTGSLTFLASGAFSTHSKAPVQAVDVAKQHLNSSLDLIIGGGAQFYNQVPMEQSFSKAAKGQGFKVYTKLKSKLKGDKVMVIAADLALPSIKEGRGQFLSEAIESSNAFMPFVTNKYLLLVEHQHIQFASQANDSKYLLEEMADLDQGIAKAVALARMQFNTLVLVVGLPEIGGLILKGGVDAQGLPKMAWHSKEPTASATPILAYGKGASLFQGNYTGIELNQMIISLLTE